MDYLENALNTYQQKFEDCLTLVEFGSKEKRRDTAFAMTLEMIKGTNLLSDDVRSLAVSLAKYAVGNQSMLENLRNNISESTSVSMDYSHFPSVMKTLSAKSYFNLDTLRYVYGDLETNLKKYSGRSPMQDSVYNVPFYGFNSALLSECVKIAEQAG